MASQSIPRWILHRKQNYRSGFNYRLEQWLKKFKTSPILVQSHQIIPIYLTLIGLVALVEFVNSCSNFIQFLLNSYLVDVHPCSLLSLVLSKIFVIILVCVRNCCQYYIHFNPVHKFIHRSPTNFFLLRRNPHPIPP